jgi:hypothetical protein
LAKAKKAGENVSNIANVFANVNAASRNLLLTPDGIGQIS